jgi:hypothetical protein
MPQRIYPAWLPPTPDQRVALERIRRMQTQVILWFAAFLPAGWIVALVTRSDTAFVPLTVVWIAAGGLLARRITEFRCPRCAARFCANSGMPFVYALFNRRCQDCGLTLNLERAAGA